MARTTIENYKKLLKEYDLPASTPEALVVELLDTLAKKRIARDNDAAVEKALMESRLWAWVQGEYRPSLAEEAEEAALEFSLDTFARRITRLIGV